MDKELIKCLQELMASRCASAILESNEYEKLQSDECTREELLDTALITGYKKCVSDMIKILLYGLK